MTENKTTSDNSSKNENKLDINIEEIFRLNLKKNQMINPSFEIYGAPTGFQTYGK